MMRRRRAGLVIGSLLAVVSAAGVHAEPARSIDYLYVESNEGGSSGGHVALRFGDRVFHFQYTDGGFLRVSRESFAGFRRHYSLLENRPIHITRIPVSGETFDLVHDFFTRRRVIQHEYFQVMGSLAGDRGLLETLRAVARGGSGSPVVLEGAGYFFDDTGSPLVTETSPRVLALRDQIAALHGPDFLSRRLEDVQQQLERLDPLDIEPPSLDLSAERAPAPVYGFAQRYKDALLAERALEVLRSGRSLRPGSYVQIADSEVALREGEERVVEELAEALATSLVRLARSDRPDWGSAMMVGLARLEALEKTKQMRVWAFLDVFAVDAPRLARARLTRQPELGQAPVREGRVDFERARAQLVLARGSDPGFHEIAFAELEASGNRLVEALRAVREGRDLRLARGRQPPARGALVSDPMVPPRVQAALDELIAVATGREAAYAARLQRLYGYQLLTRNCVTEIFREIDLAFAQGSGVSSVTRSGPVVDAAVREESRRRLGGHLEMTGLRFIPAVSAEAVSGTYTVSERLAIPSYRHARLSRLYREEPPLRVFLRESNTLTSTLYQRNPEDSYFLFFTDDTIAARPLFGVLNVATGLGATLAGVATLPFDRGKMLWAGLKGVVFSLPELVFFNIRKGSFDHIEDDRRLE
ncbi:MAG: hypothetical protein ACREKS_20065 [Candidatus Rokuibacteriota bacterium]